MGIKALSWVDMVNVIDVEIRESQLTRLREKDAAMMPLGHTLGFRVSQVTAGCAVVVMICHSGLNNILGYTHGGAIFCLADTAVGLAHLASLEAHQTATTVESKINFLRPALRGELQASARCVKKGRSLSLYECDVHDEQVRLVARISATMMTLEDDRCDDRNNLYDGSGDLQTGLQRGEGA
jgi:uncharacterized protein (TIGR00369 family)